MDLQAFHLVYSPAMSLLPARMTSAESKAMLIAIGLQESRFEHRRQLPGGAARGFFQFEAQGGIKGVLENHHATRPLIRSVLDALKYDYSVLTSYLAVEHNDTLAICYARLLLYTVAQPLPNRDQTAEGWRQYLWAWRPGKPHPNSWPLYYRQAWDAV